jgi:hypothetical protein
VSATDYPRTFAFAGIAQLVEQLICNQQVTGSIPVASSTRSKGEERDMPSVRAFDVRDFDVRDFDVRDLDVRDLDVRKIRGA